MNLVFGGYCEAFTAHLSAHLVPDGGCGCDPNSVPKLTIKELTSAVGMAHSCRTKVFSISLLVVAFNVNPAEGCVCLRVMTSLCYSEDRK